MIARDVTGPSPALVTARPALALMSGRTIGFAASFLIPVVLARVLDQADFGTYKQFFLIAATLYGIGQLGMAESLFYFLPRAPAEAGRFVANAVLALSAGGLGCLVALGLWGGTFARWLANPELDRHGMLLGGYLALAIPAAALEIAMIARKRHRLAASVYAVGDLARALCLIVPALVTGDLGWLFVGALAFAALRCALALGYLAGAFTTRLMPDASLLRTQIAYTAPFALAGLVEIIQVNVHQYWVAARFDAATFAVYAVGCLQIPLVEVAITSVLNVMMVRMSEETEAGRARAAIAVWHDSVRHLALMLFPLAAFFMVAAQPVIVLLFTERYAASAPVFAASCLALLVPVVAVDAVLRVHAETRTLFGLNVVRLAVTVAAIGPLVAGVGLVGAVLATVIAAAAAKALGLARIAVVMRLGLARLLPWSPLGRILVAALAAAVVALAVRAEMASGPLVTLAAMGTAYGVAYVAALWILGGLSESERMAIKVRLARRVVAAGESRR